ncbi:3,4-dihydroxy-2-butanone-4-phosphate synthase [Myxococcota bacterium]|nr:3,4-dihydroxy-2-butanone-4-phosphate synthase [Myxococcota bacterium]
MTKVAEGVVRAAAAIEEIRQGRMVVLTDHEDRENEGDLAMAAERVRPEDINFMATHGRGLICLTMMPDKVKQLGLRMMVTDNESPYNTAFTVSIEAREGVSTGISAADRSHTIRTAIDPASDARHVISPGHVFPLRAQTGGVLVRAGQTEGSVDLARLAGMLPAGVICEIMNEDGSMARHDDLRRFCEKHKLVQCSISDLVQYRLHHEPLVSLSASSRIEMTFEGQTRMAEFFVFSTPISQLEFLAIRLGTVTPEKSVLVRMHQGCMISDLFNLGGPSGKLQLDQSLRRIFSEGCGVLVYMQNQNDSLGTCFSQTFASSGKEAPSGDSSEAATGASAAHRDTNYGLGAQVLKYLNVGQMRLMTNSDQRFHGIRAYGLEVVERVPLG